MVEKMRKRLFLSLLTAGIAAVGGTSAVAFAATATATVDAQISSSLSVSTTTGLAFGSMTSGPLGGTVVVNANGVRFATGGVNLSTASVTSPALITIIGKPNATYAVTLPATVQLSDGTGNSMTVGNFISTPSGTGQLDGTGQQVLSIGGTLTVGANQSFGSYRGVMAVVINYN
jgi:hypothetical protein